MVERWGGRAGGYWTDHEMGWAQGDACWPGQPQMVQPGRVYKVRNSI